MIYFNKSLNCLVGKCDACGYQIYNHKGETDRCELTCGLFKEQGWLQTKIAGKWKHFCPECKAEYYKTRRKCYFENCFFV